MIAALAQLHHDIEEGGHDSTPSRLRQERKVLLQNSTIILLLTHSQLNLYMYTERTVHGGENRRMARYN